ncbi:hypothetical protein [Tsukamurella sp. 1534]|uniref:hypothetical protein n=1 Tax=Tsukamurella sp. 1534 TaxID=1151061 RepID=UPI0002FC3AEE|nr:hypothetical protein [Tsukamurella sp. 1534]
MTDPIDVRTFIQGRRVAADDVRRWEERRARAVMRTLATRLGRRAMGELLAGRALGELRADPVDVQRAALTAMKARLGHAGVYALLRPDLAASEATARVAVAASRGRSAFSVTRLEARGPSADGIDTWFDDLVASNREDVMVRACPDHYLLRALPDGRQEVVETTGGSPVATRFLVDYARTDRLATPPDPRYPVQIAGEAVLDDGTRIGGVRHQFRDRDGTLEALLTVEFPATTPPWMLRQHEWHLAVEFGNWLASYARETGASRPS